MRLHAIKWMCFLFLEADHFMRSDEHSLAAAARDLANAALFGTLLPFVFAAVSEVRGGWGVGGRGGGGGGGGGGAG